MAGIINGIDTDNEEVVALSAARVYFPKIPGKNGVRAAHPVPNLIHRWRTRGVKLPDGHVVRLEAFRSGWLWYTSKEAVARFVQAQNPGEESSPATSVSAVPALPPKKTKSRRHDAAMAELARMGVKTG